MKTILRLEARNKPLTLSGFILVGVIGLVDYLTGYEYALSVFYVLPITLVTWFSDKKLGIIACIVSAIVWFWADVSAGHPYSHPFIPYWNSLIRFSFFIIISSLLSALKNAFQRERELSCTDYLTGASNSRHFYEMVQMEVNRMKRTRRPFTIAYLDVDNFKTINDKFGHLEGDLLLKTMVSSIKLKIRSTDLIARLGGDELALFFPEIDQQAARIIFPKIHEALLAEMEKNSWMVTFSIGVVTCVGEPHSFNELIKAGDDLMYSAKHHGKNMVKYSVYGAENLVRQKAS